MGRGAAAAAAEMASREERCKTHGIDCPDSLEWITTSVGKPQTKSFAVRNIKTTAMVLKFKIPQTKHFTTEYPEPLKLVPGMSGSVLITFKASALASFSDFLEFESPAGTFRIALIASLPLERLEVRRSPGWCFCLTYHCYARELRRAASPRTRPFFARSAALPCRRTPRQAPGPQCDPACGRRCPPPRILASFQSRSPRCGRS